MGGTIRTVLFDLDGTLVDTAPDLGYALNLLRAQHGLPALTMEVIRPQASHGSPGLLQLGFGVDPDHADFPALRQSFLTLYEAHLCTHSVLFPGMDKTLQTLEQRGLNWGVVTNKPARYTEPLLAQLGLDRRAACIVSGDTCPQPKPHPGPLLHACELAGSSAGQCLYVGDAERDVVAASAAGMPTLVALYGYLDVHDRPDSWGAVGSIQMPAELIAWLDTRN